MNRKELAKSYAKSIKSSLINKIILFGSVAWNEDKKDSDIDILVIANDKYKVEDDIYTKAYDIYLEKDNIYQLNYYLLKTTTTIKTLNL